MTTKKTSTKVNEIKEVDLFKARLTLNDLYIEYDDADPQTILLGDEGHDIALWMPTETFLAFARALEVAFDEPDEEDA